MHPYRFCMGMSKESATEMMDVLEAGMTPQYPRLYFLDLLSFHANKAQVQLQQNVLHRKVRRHAPNGDDFLVLAFSRTIFRRCKAQRAGFVQGDIVWRYPFTLAIVFIHRIFIYWRRMGRWRIDMGQLRIICRWVCFCRSVWLLLAVVLIERDEVDV